MSSRCRCFPPPGPRPPSLFPLLTLTALLALAAPASRSGAAEAEPLADNETLYANQDPHTETRRSEHFRLCFGHFNRDHGTPMTESLAQGNLQMFEQMWHCWVVELGLNDVNTAAGRFGGPKYRANFNFLMTWNDGGGGGAYSSMDANGFFYAMANPGYCRFDPPSGATPHEFGHVWQGTAAGFNGSDSSGSWWEGHANWMQLQFLNTYPQAGAYLYNGIYYPSHGRDYYDSFMIWEAAREHARYGAAWVNQVWTNASPSQRVNEYMIDRMIRCDSSGSADRAGAIKDLWGDMARRLVTWDFERQRWLATVNRPDDGSHWEFYQRCRTPLTPVPGRPGWFRPARAHLPMQFGFNLIPLTVNAGTTVACDFQPLCDPVRQSDWRACLVAVNNAGEASYSSLWNVGVNTLSLSADQGRCYLVVIATPKPLKIAEPAWRAYLTDAGRQFPYEVAFSGATPAQVTYPPQSRQGMTRHANGGGWKANTATVDPTAYVGPNAQVLNTAQVRGLARIEDYAVVRNSAQVRDQATVSGYAVVEGNAKVLGHAKVRDWARVFGHAEVSQQARVIEHANCGDGSASSFTSVSGSAVVKGTAYVYSPSTFTGGLIVDGDSANGNGATPASKGVHLGWAWGLDPGRFAILPDNGWLFAQHTFEQDNAVFALDELGLNHGFLRGGCGAAKDEPAPTRGGRVLALNGIDQYVELHPAVNDTREGTFALWFKPTSEATDQRVWSLGDGGARELFLTPRAAASGGLQCVISDGLTTHRLAGPAVPANAWTHVAVVFTEATCVLYVNGEAVATEPALLLHPDSLNAPRMENAHYLGRGPAGNYFAGLLDDVRVYLRPLSAAEVQQLHTLPAPAPVSVTSDQTAPGPNPPTWLVAPTASEGQALTMSATPGEDASGWVEYYFACVGGGGRDSGWVSFNKYTDVAAPAGVPVTYTVRMRDRAGNTTAPSAPLTAVLAAPSPPAAAFSYGPLGVAAGQITMTAAAPAAPGPRREYKFDRVTPPGASSGWQSSPTWTHTGLTAGSTHSYTVSVRLAGGEPSPPSAPAGAAARDDAAPRLPIAAAHWNMRPYATIDNRVSMTAQEATDAAGLEYQFQCVSGGGPDSAWQSSRTFVTPALADGTYVYRYRVRDTSPQRNPTDYSTPYAARITPTTGYHVYALSQVPALPDDYLVRFPATVMKVSSNHYQVKDLASAISLKVRPSTSNQVTDASLALRNVLVSGHLYTFAGAREVTFATLSVTGDPALYTISGRVTEAAGLGVAGATVHFADVPGAASNALATATTDADGYYSRGVVPGLWYVTATASAYNAGPDRLVNVPQAHVAGVDLTLTPNARISGQVVRVSDGAAISGAAVYFSRTAAAATAPVFTTTTDDSGYYRQPAQDGVWHVSAGGAAFHPSADQVVTVEGRDVTDIHFALRSNAREIPRSDDLLFSVVTESLPASGVITQWPSYRPAGQTLAAMNQPRVEVLDGVKWVKQTADGPGFRQGIYAAPLPLDGATIVLAARPKRVPSNNWDSLVDIFYDRLVFGLRNDTGQINVRRNGSLHFSSATIPDGQITLLSLVVQPNGQYAVWANGTLVYTNNTTSPMTALTNGIAGGFANAINLGRNDPDGWTTFNGHLGDVFVYATALSTAERLALESGLRAKFLPGDHPITVTTTAGGYVNPGGVVRVPPGGTQSFRLTPRAGYTVSDLVVDGVARGPADAWTFANVTAAHTLHARFAPLPPPALTIATREDGLLEISWPDHYAATLMQSPGLDSPAGWTPAPGPPQPSGGRYRVVVSPGPSTMFFVLFP